MEQTKIKGDIAEAKALFEFSKRKIPVLIPWGDKDRYDMVIEYNQRFLKVQVKYCGEECNGAIICYARSSQDNRTHKNYFLYKDDVDFLFFYNEKYDKCALVPIKEIGEQSTISLRITPTKNNQRKNIRFFDDYSIDKTLCVETLHENSFQKE